MISVNEAREILENNYPNKTKQLLPLSDAAGMVLAENVAAQCDVPNFDNSAMDGYAFDFDSWRGKPLEIQGESAAGKPLNAELQVGCAARIFTGAMLPKGANTVVMQEKVIAENGQLTILDEQIKKGSNVRLQASQNKNGDVVMVSHQLLTPGSIAFLASCGVYEVEAYVAPRVSIIVTGDEIVSPGTQLKAGEVYECNSYGLAAVLKSLNIDAKIAYCKDNLEEIHEVVNHELNHCDILLVTGGVSVGDYDYVVPALRKCGVTQLFHGVKQKPAKPLFSGYIKNQLVFGLPGNPASVLTSFYVYVLPAIRHALGLNNNKITGFLDQSFSRKAGLTQFLKGQRTAQGLRIVEGQESYRMDGFAIADCLIEIPENESEISTAVPLNIIPF